MKSNKSMSQKKYLNQNPFFAISKMALKLQKMQFREIDLLDFTTFLVGTAVYEFKLPLNDLSSIQTNLLHRSQCIIDPHFLLIHKRTLPGVFHL